MLCHVRDLRVPLYLLLTKLDVLVGQFMIKDTWTPYDNMWIAFWRYSEFLPQ